ncbi:hypothetical protein RBS60_11830 [Sinomonas sp. ASV486]|nr:hypothetical protein [Sinomonas sp. ASV486]
MGAVPPPPLNGSTFEGGDGNLTVDTAGNTDWANVAGLHTGIDQPSGSGDNAFGQGTKEDSSAVTVVDGSIPPNKNDLTRFYEASETASNNHTYLYLAWERLVNIGNANLDFEINQKATTGFTGTTTGPLTLNRTAGDLLVSYDFGGSGTPTLGINTWLTAAAGNTVGQCYSANALPCWGNHLVLNGTVSQGAVNTVQVTDPIANQNLGVGLFGEAAIDLTAAGVIPPGTCEAFGSAFVKSRSSSSFTAEIKDFIAPIAVNISNCGSITIKKVTQNAPAGDKTSFAYTTSPNLKATGNAFSLQSGGVQAFASLPSATYTVSEGTQSAPWNFVDVVCDPNTHVTTTGQMVSIALANTENVVCTYTNHYTNSPTIATTLSATTITAGSSAHDSATLSGASANAGGTVTYSVFSDNACSVKVSDAGTVTVTAGSVPNSNDVTFNTAGTYFWQAAYSGDANNNGATSPCTSEQLVVKTKPTIATTLSATSITVGGSVHDSAALTGATSTAGGSVTYTVYTDNKCSAGARDAGTVTVTNGIVPNSNDLAFNTAGDYFWQAVYTGDAFNNGATSTCTDEHLVVNKAQPGESTAQNLIPNDSFTLTGGFNPTGTITFNLYAPSDATCSAAPALSQTVSVNNGNNTYTTTNSTFLATSVGTWRWMSTYSGDANNQAATSACGTENFTINNG